MSSFDRGNRRDNQRDVGMEVVERPAPEHPHNIALMAYFEQLPRDRGLPQRRDFDPVDIPALLHGIFMAEPMEGGDYRYRLVASSLENRMGLFATGRTAREMFDDEMYAALTGTYTRVLTVPETVTLRGRLEGLEIEFIDFEGLLLPFRNGPADEKILIGGMFAFN